MPFQDILKPERIQQALDEAGVHVRRCTFGSVLTLYAFLAQVLNSDPSCRQASCLLLAWLGMSMPQKKDGSIDTSAYCKARARLPAQVAASLTLQVGRELSRQHKPAGLLQGRRLKIVDGSTCSMPDTPANQAAYPQSHTRKRYPTFPILRFVVILCLATGVVLNAAEGPYLGKRTGETALLRKLEDELEEGDILLGDRYFCSYWQIARLRALGVDCVFRMHQLRRVDFRKGEHLGHWDHIATWKKPKERPEWMNQKQYDSVPAEMRIREVRRRIAVKGFRVRHLVLATTLLDAQLYPAEELTQAVRFRWHAEVDLRSIKAAMKMDVLRCKTPAMVRSEFWMHLLAYNLVRTVMAAAADACGHLPRQISFTAAIQLIRTFSPLFAMLSDEAEAERLHQLLLIALGKELVGDRPNRYEPRAIKRRPKPHRLLTEPREKARRRMQRSAK